MFCGQKPEKRNREHVIPRWLNAVAGNENKPANIWTPNGPINLLWSNLTLPACTECNQRFGRLEELMKEAFGRIERGYYLGTDADLLLDWMDKIRVGLWRLQLAHGKDGHDIKPNYSVSERLASSDRLVRVLKYKTESKGIGLVGTDTAAWIRMPSAMALVVKDVVILSVSAGGFLQEAMGLVKVVNTVKPEGDAYPYEVARPTGKYNEHWANQLFRFGEQRVFTFHAIGEAFDQPVDQVCTDAGGRISPVADGDTVQVRTVSVLPSCLKTLVSIEVLELQRHLLRAYARLDLPAAFLPRLRAMYRELDQRIELLTDIHDSIAPLPTFRRPYLRWV